MAPHRIDVELDSTASSIIDSDFLNGHISTGSDDASNPTLSETEPIAIVGMGKSTLSSRACIYHSMFNY